jgi:F-box protein 3
MTLPDDYRCSLRIHNGQKEMNRPGVLGSTHIANHFKREALLNVKTATLSLAAHMDGDLRGCIPITLCVINTCGHYMAVSEEAGHKQGCVFWPSLDNETVNLSGYGSMDCFIMADNFSQWFTSYAENLVKESYPVIRGEIYPFKSASQHTGDNGITVKTATCFLPELSSVSPPRFFFTYRITMLMDQSFPRVRRRIF